MVVLSCLFSPFTRGNSHGCFGALWCAPTLEHMSQQGVSGEEDRELREEVRLRDPWTSDPTRAGRWVSGDRRGGGTKAVRRYPWMSDPALAGPMMSGRYQWWGTEAAQWTLALKVGREREREGRRMWPRQLNSQRSHQRTKKELHTAQCTRSHTSARSHGAHARVYIRTHGPRGAK